MVNRFTYNSEPYKAVEAKLVLNSRIFEGVYVMDWRPGCDTEGCENRYHNVRISYQIRLDDNKNSEDHYCVDCLFHKVYKELYGKVYSNTNPLFP